MLAATTVGLSPVVSNQSLIAHQKALNEFGYNIARKETFAKHTSKSFDSIESSANLCSNNETTVFADGKFSTLVCNLCYIFSSVSASNNIVLITFSSDANLLNAQKSNSCIAIFSSEAATYIMHSKSRNSKYTSP